MKHLDRNALRALVKQGEQAREEVSRRQAERRDRINRKLIGRTFKRRNSYGTPGEFWYLYGQIVNVAGGNVRMRTFEWAADGKIMIEQDGVVCGETFPPTEWTEIPLDEFKEAWNSVCSRLDALSSRIEKDASRSTKRRVR